MPAPAEYLQFLTPNRPAEQVPDSQINTQGPFSAQLTQPAFRAPQVHEPGFGGTGHALLSFANQFLAGASEGRLRQFQQSEQTKKEHERNLDAVVQHIQNDPGFTKDFKDKALEDLLMAKAGAAQGTLGKGKTDNKAVNLAKGIFTSIVGPHDNKAHVDIGPEHVADLISQMHDPNNQFDAAGTMATSMANLNQAISDIKKAAVGPDGQPIPLTRNQVAGHQKVVDALMPLMKQGYDAYNMPPIAAVLGQLPPDMTPAEKENLARSAAQRKMYEGKTLPNGLWNYTNSDNTPGSAMIDFRDDAQGNPQPFFTMTGKPVPPDHPLKQNGTYSPQNNVRWTIGGTNVDDGNGNITRYPTYGASGKGPPPPGFALPGTPAPPVAGAPAATPPAAGQPTAAPPVTGAPAATPPAAVPAATAPPPGSPQAIIVATAAKYGVDPNIALSIARTESQFNPAAVGPATRTGEHAVGVMQLMPDTAKAMGVNDPTDPAQNIEGGVKYFKQLLDQYGGDTNKALAAYNAGPGAVTSGKIPDETKTYVSRVMAGAGGGQTAPPVAEAGTPTHPPGYLAPGTRVAGGGVVLGRKPSTNSNVDYSDLSMTPEQSTQLKAQRAENPSMDLDAWDYLLTHRISSVRGMGKDVQPQVRKIKQVGNQIAKELGLDPGELYARGTELKGNIAAYTKVTTQAAQIEAFEGVLQKNADLANQLSDAFKRGDIPFLNKIAEAYNTGVGDSEAKNLAAQLHTVGTEWAKIQSGSVSAQGVPAPVQAAVNAQIGAGITNGQLKSLIDNVIKPDAKNRTDANRDEQAKLVGQIRGVTRPNTRSTSGTSNPNLVNPNPDAYVVGHLYGDLEYIGGDPLKRSSFRKVAQ